MHAHVACAFPKHWLQCQQQQQQQQQHSTAQHSTAQHSTAQHSTAQHKHSTSQAQDLCSIHDLRSTAQHMTHLAGSLISSQTYSVQCKSHTSKRQTGDKQSHCLHIIHDHKFHSANAI